MDHSNKCCQSVIFDKSYQTYIFNIAKEKWGIDAADALVNSFLEIAQNPDDSVLGQDHWEHLKTVMSRQDTIKPDFYDSSTLCETIPLLSSS